jgi:hypothetical protein
VSLYREAPSGRRRLWIAAAVAAVGLAAVATLFLATSRGGPSQQEKLESLQGDVQPALAALELIPLHYESPNPTTHAAAADQLEVARDAIRSVESDLRALDPAGTTRLLADLRDLSVLVRTTGEIDLVEREASKTASDLRALVRLD